MSANPRPLCFSKGLASFTGDFFAAFSTTQLNCQFLQSEVGHFLSISFVQLLKQEVPGYVEGATECAHPQEGREGEETAA